MNMIDKDKLTTLISASEARSLSQSALISAESSTIAYAINNAVNTGETSVLYNNIISSSMMEKLESAGYLVEPFENTAKPGTQYKISW